MVKTIAVKDEVWEKLVALKLEMKKKNMNEVVEQLVKHYIRQRTRLAELKKILDETLI